MQGSSGSAIAHQSAPRRLRRGQQLPPYAGIQLFKQSRHAERSSPERQVDERLARLERLEAWFAEQEWDHETRGWFRRKQKRRRKSATPVVNVYNTPRLWTGVGPKRKTEAPHPSWEA
jgi:hypothetical protein